MNDFIIPSIKDFINRNELINDREDATRGRSTFDLKEVEVLINEYTNHLLAQNNISYDTSTNT